MSNNYVVIESDTTGPQIEVIAPTYTTPNSVTEIRIQSNKPLSNWQEIYALDALGNRQDLTFEYHEDHFIGHVIFNFCSLGLVTIYAQTKDRSLNTSNLASKIIYVMESLPVFLQTSEQGSKLAFDEMELTCERVTADG
jgi:hypothetical protein